MSAAHFTECRLTQFLTSLGQLSAESVETKPLLPTFVIFWFWNISIKPLMEIINIMAWESHCFLLSCHVQFQDWRCVRGNFGPRGVCVVCYPSPPLLNLRLSFYVYSFQNKVKFSKVSLQRWSNSHITNGDGWQGQWIQISFNCGGSYCHCLSIWAFEYVKICSVHSVKWCIQLNASEFTIFSQG